MSDKKDKKKENTKDQKIEETVIAKETTTEDVFEEGKNIDELTEEVLLQKKNKNYLAVIILLLGLLVGSLFVDVMQFVTGNGYSKQALKEANIFSLGDKTWVAYQEPIVKLNILTVADDKMKDCPTCKLPVEIVDTLKKMMPTLIVKEINVDSEEGKKIVKENNIKSIPAMIFSNDVEQTKFYNSEAKVLFVNNKDKDNFIFNLSGLGIPVGKYLSTPEIDTKNPIIGNRNAKVKIILFSDHQCPYCAKFFDEIVRVSKNFGDKVVLVYKDLPLEFHPQSMNSAIAGACANEQGKFWEMSKRLYTTQKQWGGLKDDKVKAFFKQQAKILRLDSQKFDKCLDANRYKDEIEKSKKEAQEFGIAGTPSIFINDKFLPGVVPEQQLKDIIQKEIDKAEK